MRLKKLIVQGFKSFADRTEFVFDVPITGVVGPNGCGKSNVVDAFKWVLGEQSAKSLRGEAMLDVVFNGAATRKASGMAEVVLVFDNPKREDGSRALEMDCDEVHVGRRLFREGGSEYQLNGSATRLRDIRELFLDTGVGVDAYSVIEQGKVAALLEANPAERRVIFEEAAGISKFKAKKKEAVRKLDKVEQNLLRLNDIVEEVEKRLRSVRIQAGRARTYKEHAERLKELRLSYAVHDYHTQFTDLQTKRAAEQEQTAHVEQMRTGAEQATQQLAERRAKVEELSTQKQRSEHELVEAKSRQESAKQRQQYARQQVEESSRRSEALQQQQSDTTARQETATSSLAESRSSLEALTEQVQQHEQQIGELEQKNRAMQHERNEAQNQLEQEKSASLDLMRKSANIGNQLNGLEVEQRNAGEQRERLQARKGEVQRAMDEHQQQLQGVDAELETLHGDIAETQQMQEVRKQASVDMGRQISQLSEEMGAAREHRSGLMSRQKLLSDLESRREGMGEGVKQILRERERFGFIRGVAADVMRVDVEHAAIIEAALDGRDQLLISDSADATIAAADALDELDDRVAVLNLDRLKPIVDRVDWQRHPQRIRMAADLVRVDPEHRGLLDHLLGRTVVVESLADAEELQRLGPASYRYVTELGEVVEADGTVRAGAMAGNMGILSRRSELESLAAQLADVDARIAELQQHIESSTESARKLEEELNGIRNELYRLNGSKVELTSRHREIKDKLSALEREQPLLEREDEALARRIAELDHNATALKQQKQQMETEQAERESNVERLAARMGELEGELKTIREQLTNSRVAHGQLQQKQLGERQQVQRLEAQVQELTQLAERLTNELEAVKAKYAEAESDLSFAVDDERQAVEQVEALQTQVQQLQQQWQEVSGGLQELAADQQRLQHELQQAEGALHKVQMQIGQLEVRIDGLVQRTREELDLDVPQRYSEYHQPGGYDPGDIDFEAVGVEIKELRDKIQRLGNVNLDAIDEMAELEERSGFLTNQVTDLNTSRTQLQQLIAQINEESSLRFQQCFEAVREHFQSMFRRLFGGGKADVMLETELPPLPVKPNADGSMPEGEPQVRKVDPLDAGIEIIARPPGKQPASISQLSGGEKAMTCVALLLSIFKSKPSPFCILDEVDAPLDEANNVRFNEIIQEFARGSQFIVITHSKTTMQISQKMYGVTMQERGVSKRVSVKFDQVDAQGRISETAAA